MNDRKLSPHFSFFELTATSSPDLQAKNRELTPEQWIKLGELADHCEAIRGIVGQPVKIHSGYRCPDVNGATVGSSSTSQHPRCEAVDFDVPGQDVEETFGRLLVAARAGRLRFGQLIIERAQRSYGAVAWVHCSVIGTLDAAKVGQVMKMTAGPDGKPHYELVCKLDFKEVA